MAPAWQAQSAAISAAPLTRFVPQGVPPGPL
jgi:hypothetical protein